MKVGVVCPYALDSPGGVQQLCLDLADRLRGDGHEAFVVGPGRFTHMNGPGRDSTTIPVGRPVAIKANESVVPMSLSPRSWGRVRRALDDVDVIHVHEPLVPIVGWSALSVSKPRVVTFHADAPQWVGRAYRVAPWMTTKMRKSVMTAVSQTARESVPSRWGDVRIIPNAVDVASFQPPVGRIQHRVAFLGRDEPRKGLDILLEAWPAIRASNPKAELLVMGANRDDDIDGVRFVGRVTGGEKHRLLASSSVFVAPNTGGESFGIVLAEAMAAGCAIVASDLASFRSVLGDSGILVPVADVSALSEAVSQLLTDDAQLRRYSDAGQKTVQRYDWSVVMGEYQKAYEVALSTG